MESKLCLKDGWKVNLKSIKLDSRLVIHNSRQLFTDLEKLSLYWNKDLVFAYLWYIFIELFQEIFRFYCQ